MYNGLERLGAPLYFQTAITANLYNSTNHDSCLSTDNECLLEYALTWAAGVGANAALRDERWGRVVNGPGL
jgi:hypothetical protein